MITCLSKYIFFHSGRIFTYFILTEDLSICHFISFAILTTLVSFLCYCIFLVVMFHSNLSLSLFLSFISISFHYLFSTIFCSTQNFASWLRSVGCAVILSLKPQQKVPSFIFEYATSLTLKSFLVVNIRTRHLSRWYAPMLMVLDIKLNLIHPSVDDLP